jgi:hypothetical protein
MASFLSLRDDGGFPLGLPERNLRGQTMPSTAISGCATNRAGLIPGLRGIARRAASFRAVGGAKISETLIGCVAIENRRKPLKVKVGDHY